jgi:hypothetical protein
VINPDKGPAMDTTAIHDLLTPKDNRYGEAKTRQSIQI